MNYEPTLPTIIIKIHSFSQFFFLFLRNVERNFLPYLMNTGGGIRKIFLWIIREVKTRSSEYNTTSIQSTKALYLLFWTMHPSGSFNSKLSFSSFCCMRLLFDKFDSVMNHVRIWEIWIYFCLRKCISWIDTNVTYCLTPFPRKGL